MKINEFKLEEYFAKYEFEVKYLLCASDCESFNVEEILNLDESYRKKLKGLRLGYTESRGHPKLREEIAKLYDDIMSDDIIVFAGAEEGIFIFMNVFLNKGDHVIVQFPAYQSLFEVANALNIEITKWKMVENENWGINLNLLEQSIKSNTKCIVLNFPHNPTGFLPTKNEFKKIIEIAKKNNIFIFSDEVYRYLEYDKKDRLPGICEVYSKSASLGVMSKTFGLAGLRIGWIATKNHQLLDDLASFKNYTTICNSALSEFFSIIALKNKQHLINRNLQIIEKNLEYLDSFFKKFEDIFIWYKPKAGSIAFPKLTLNLNIEKICIDLIKNKNTLLMPATKYDYDTNHFRIGFGRKNMPIALSKFEDYINEFLL